MGWGGCVCVCVWGGLKSGLKSARGLFKMHEGRPKVITVDFLFIPGVA